MKLIFKFLLSLALYIYLTNGMKIDKQKNVQVLGSVPQGRNLRNFFGVSKVRNLYGPPPALNLENLLIKNEDSSWTKIPNPAFANELVTPDGKKCDINKHAYYDICKAATTCSLCVSIESCGWCFNTSSCLPGNIDGCFCKDDCPDKWFQSDLQCPDDGKVVLGQMSNISPFATKFVSAKLTNPKINMTVTTVQPGWEKERMILGTTVTRKNVTAYNEIENRIVEGEINLEEKVIRDVSVPAMEINQETKTYDLKSGKEIVSNQTKEFHGINKTNF